MPARAATILLVIALALSALPAAAEEEEPMPKGAAVIWTGPVDGCQYERMLAVESSGATLDIAFVGSSLTFRGIHSAQILEGLGDPDALVQNAGQPGQPISSFAWWADEVVVPITRPDVVVIGLASRDLILAGDQQTPAGEKFEGAMGREFVAGGDLQFALDQIAAGNRAPAFRAALRRPDLITPPLTDAWDPVAAGYEPPGWQLRDQWRSNCSQIRDQESNVFTGSAEWERNRLQQRQLLPWQLGAGLNELTRLVRKLKRAGVTPVILNLPVTPDYIAAHPSGEQTYDNYRAAVEAIAVSEQILLVDAVEYFTVDRGVFRDMTHLNKWGARRLSRRIGRVLRNPAAARVVCLKCS